MQIVPFVFSNVFADEISFFEVVVEFTFARERTPSVFSFVESTFPKEETPSDFVPQSPSPRKDFVLWFYSPLGRGQRGGLHNADSPFCFS